MRAYTHGHLQYSENCFWITYWHCHTNMKYDNNFTLVSGKVKSTNINNNMTLAENTSSVLDTPREVMKIGPSWFAITIPIQNALLQMEIINPTIEK